MSKLQQLDVFVGTNIKIGRLILPVGTETEFSFIYEDEWKHTDHRYNLILYMKSSPKTGQVN